MGTEHETEPSGADAIVLLGGAPVAPGHTRWPVGALVVAADSGVEQAGRLGLSVDVAVGDFDSVDPAALAAAEAAGAVVERHPRAKDLTDAALALDAAVARGARRLLVVGGEGGRLDHLLANVLLLASDTYAGVEITALGAGGARLHVVRTERRIAGRPGELVSLLPAHGPARGVRTEGLRYPLRGETLHAGTSRGVSNELLGDAATVVVDAGVLLVVLPGRDHPTTDHPEIPS
jgi:thiamine pyrophosphokinase